MNPDILTQTIQKGFRIGLGATASLLESLQDPQKWSENVNKLTTDPNQLTEEWAEKGETTEREARNLVENLLQQPISTEVRPVTETSPTPAQQTIQQELHALTTELAAIRTELEAFNKPGSNAA